MAGGNVEMSAPWYMPLTWPFGHIATAYRKDPEDKIPSPSAMPELDMMGHLTSMAAAFRSFALAYFCIYVLYSGENYPAFGAAKEWSWAWMWPIIVRDLVATWAICGFWDWFLYFSPLKEKLHKYKFDPKYPALSAFKHDAIASTIASLTGAAIEIALCHYWATGAIRMTRNISDAPLVTVIAALTTTHWRVPHFWAIHRFIHPWRLPFVPDVGAFLYMHIHKQHHKSYNPSAFSGTNMHPVESTAYYSSCLIAVAFGAHPAVVVGCIIDCAMGAWLGHDGFAWPGSGDYFHMLHHMHFDCNFGAMHVPIDKWLGTFAGCKADIKKIWGVDAKAGAEHNPTLLHGTSTSWNKAGAEHNPMLLHGTSTTQKKVD